MHGIDRQNRRNTFQPTGNAVMRGDLAILVETANIDLGDHEVLRKERSKLGQFHDAGEHAAIEAPVAAEIDQQPLMLALRLRTRPGDDGLRVRGLVIGKGQRLRQLLDARNRQPRCWRRGKSGNRREGKERAQSE